MLDEIPQTYTAFQGHKLLVRGRLDEVVLGVKSRLETNPALSVLIFSDSTGKQMDFNLRGSDSEVLERLQVYLPPKQEAPVENSGPGRPKLGVVAREVSLLPRHWEWLSTQSGGASATLRRLVEEARKGTSSRERVRQAQEAVHRFMTALAGDLPHFEEALRALFAKNGEKFRQNLTDWPVDVRKHVLEMAAPIFESDR